MNVKGKETLLELLNQYYQEKAKTCNYDCCNCNFGVLESYGSGHSCSIEIVERLLGEELYY